MTSTAGGLGTQGRRALQNARSQEEGAADEPLGLLCGSWLV